MGTNWDNMTDEGKSTTLVKHTAAVHITNVLSLNQRKIANILLKNAYSELKSGTWHSISIRDLLGQLGWGDSSNVTEMLKNDLKTLNTAQLEWNVLNVDRKKVWNVTTFLADAKIENGIIHYSYSLALREALYNPNIYAKLDLLVQRQFKTKHAIVLWEYISCEISSIGDKSRIYTKWISLEDLKKILGLQDSKAYASFNALNQKVLVPGITEINNNSKINVTLEIGKEQRKTDKLRFVVDRVKPSNTVSIPPTRIQNKFANDIGVTPEQLEWDIKKYGEDRVNFALEYTKKQIDLGKVINNVVAFYKVALRENWTEGVTSTGMQNTQLDEKIAQLEGSANFMNLFSALRKRVGDNVFRSWFLNLEFVSEDENKITLGTNSTFVKDYILMNFFDELKSASAETTGNKTVDIILYHIK